MTLPSGKRACAQACSAAYFETYSSDQVCFDHVTVACSKLPPETSCGCGCPVDAFCKLDPLVNVGACAPLVDVGGDCTKNLECRSGHCSEVSYSVRRCAGPVGSACTAATCPVCLDIDSSAGTPGWCSSACEPGSCPTGSTCLTADATSSSARCYVDCSPANPACPPALRCRSWGSANGYACLPG